MAAIAIAGAIAVLRQAISIVGNLAVQEGCRLLKLKEDMEWVEREMRYIQAYLEDVEANDDQHHTSKVEATLLKDIRDLAFDVEDIVETYFPKIVSQKGKGFSGRLKNTAHMLKGGHAAYQFVAEIEKIRRRVENIPRVRDTYGTERRTGSSKRDIWETRRDFLRYERPILVGFEEHKKNLVGKLLDQDSRHPIISIVGMPGVGKTTLAKGVYNIVTSPRTDVGYAAENCFEYSAKVSVSQRPNVIMILQDIARQVGLEKEKRDAEDVKANLRAYLEDKRYVILFDDIWDTQDWDDLQSCIPNPLRCGSKVILTSRNTEIGVNIGGVNSIYKLKPLKEDESWELFSKMVMEPLEITDGLISNVQEFELLGKQIVERCGGVPLAIGVVAGLLKGKEKVVDQWKAVLESMGQNIDMCSRVLALSYKDLPVELKPCFLYFGLFPEDCEIFAFDLINLWVAEGFVQGKGELEPEDAGEDYLNQLIARNMIEAGKRRYDGRIRTCRIHDLLHTFCIQVASESNFFITYNEVIATNLSPRVRRVTTNCTNPLNWLSLLPETAKLRSLLCFHKESTGKLGQKQVEELFESCKRLQVLSLYCVDLTNHSPDIIGNLTHLRYLRSLDSFVQRGVPAIGNLKCLITLDLRAAYCNDIPKEIWGMKQLRHILLQKHWSPSGTNNHFLERFRIKSKGSKVQASLPNLQTLYTVPGNGLEAEWLPKFTQLRKLGISDSTISIFEILFKVMPASNKLENLSLRSTKSSLGCTGDDSDRATSARFLDQFCFTPDLSRYQCLRKLLLGIPMRELPKLPLNLIKLTLEAPALEKDPMKTLAKLPKLKILKFISNSDKRKKIVCGQKANDFPELEVLDIACSSDVRLYVVKDAVLPKLQQLVCCNPFHVEAPGRIRKYIIIRPRW